MTYCIPNMNGPHNYIAVRDRMDNLIMVCSLCGDAFAITSTQKGPLRELVREGVAR